MFSVFATVWPCVQIEPLPAATVDKLQSRIVDGAAPILANLPHMTAADERTIRSQAGWAQDVATKTKRVGQSTPIGKPGEAYECTYRLKGSGSREINRYRYTALPGKSSPPIYTNGAFVLRLNKLKSRWEACAVDTATPCYYASVSSHSSVAMYIPPHRLDRLDCDATGGCGEMVLPGPEVRSENYETGCVPAGQQPTMAEGVDLTTSMPEVFRLGEKLTSFAETAMYASNPQVSSGAATGDDGGQMLPSRGKPEAMPLLDAATPGRLGGAMPPGAVLPGATARLRKGNKLGSSWGTDANNAFQSNAAQLAQDRAESQQAVLGRAAEIQMKRARKRQSEQTIATLLKGVLLVVLVVVVLCLVQMRQAVRDCLSKETEGGSYGGV